MTTIRLIFAAMLAAILTFTGASVASAELNDYGSETLTVSGPTGPVQPGAEFSVTWASGSLAGTWALDPFQGQTRDPGPSPYTATLTAPMEPGTYEVTARFVQAANTSSAPAASGVAQVTQASFATTRDPRGVPRTYVLTVAAPSTGSASDSDDDKGGILPDTGGARLGLLAFGGLLIAGGAAVTMAARRRSA